MRSWYVRLEAKWATRRPFRSYELAVGPDFFGAWMVEMSYGRIGTAGRTKVRSFERATQAEADAYLNYYTVEQADNDSLDAWIAKMSAQARLMPPAAFCWLALPNA